MELAYWIWSGHRTGFAQSNIHRLYIHGPFRLHDICGYYLRGANYRGFCYVNDLIDVHTMPT